MYQIIQKTCFRSMHALSSGVISKIVISGPLLHVQDVVINQHQHNSTGTNYLSGHVLLYVQTWFNSITQTRCRCTFTFSCYRSSELLLALELAVVGVEEVWDASFLLRAQAGGQEQVMSAARVDLPCILMLLYKDHRWIRLHDQWSSPWWDMMGRLVIYTTNCSNLHQVHLIPAIRVVSSTFKSQGKGGGGGGAY